jgi:hypothetical protein
VYDVEVLEEHEEKAFHRSGWSGVGDRSVENLYLTEFQRKLCYDSGLQMQHQQTLFLELRLPSFSSDLPSPFFYNERTS